MTAAALAEEAEAGGGIGEPNDDELAGAVHGDFPGPLEGGPGSAAARSSWSGGGSTGRGRRSTVAGPK